MADRELLRERWRRLSSEREMIGVTNGPGSSLMTAYRKVDKKFAGGQAEVWLGVRQDDGQHVAMKYLHVHPASADPVEDLKRFKRELRCHSTLIHENIMPVLGQNTMADPPWYVMPWADESLRTRLTPVGTVIPETEALGLFRQVIEAVAFAHSEGVLHRDLKPENILFLEGRPVVADFGLALRQFSGSTTLTMTNVGMGTLAYSAPEQFTDAHNVDERADVYALGKILFELLTGRFPFPRVHLPVAPARFRYIIGRCIEDDPSKRYHSVVELRRELELLMDSPEKLHAPLERAQTLLKQVMSGDLSAITDLNRLLLENGDDELLYKKFVPYMQRPVIAAYMSDEPKGFEAVLQQFDEYAAGSHPWSYTDVIADFFADVFDLSGDLKVRRMVLERVLLMGYEHNRYHVGDVAVRLFGACASDASEVLMAAEVLQGNPIAAGFVAGGLRQRSLPPAMLKALPQAS